MCKGPYENSIFLIIRMGAHLSKSAGTGTGNATGRREG